MAAAVLLPVVLAIVALNLYNASTPELIHAAATRKPDRVEALLRAGTNVNAATVNGSTALHFAALNGDVSTALVLLRYRAQVDSRNRQGETPLMLALLPETASMVTLLLDRGADPNARANTGLTALHHAALQDSWSIAKILIARGAQIEASNDRGVRPLHVAAQEGSIAVMKLLLAHGAGVDAPIHDGSTALHIAASNGRLESVELLIAHKAAVEARDASGLTPLLAASLWGRTEAAALLRKLGADGKATDRGGRSASDLARTDSRARLIAAMDRMGTGSVAQPQSSWAIFVDRTAWVLSVVWFPIWTARRNKRARSNWRGRIICYAGTVAICFGALMLTAIVHGLVSGLLQIPMDPDVSAVRNALAVAGGGLLALWIARRYDQPVKETSVGVAEPQAAAVAAAGAGAGGSAAPHVRPLEAWSCPRCGIINTAGSEKCDCGYSGDVPSESAITVALPSEPRPWHRFFARAMDGVLAGSALGLLEIAFAQSISSWVLWNRFLTPSLGLLVWIPLEALCLAGWATTPGKWLFHIRVVDRGGNPLSFETALGRSWTVFLKGVGLGIALVGVFTQIKAYHRLTTRGLTSWDEQYCAVVTHGGIGAGRVLGIAAAALFVLILTMSQLP